MKQIYCKEGTLCCQYRLEARIIVKKIIPRLIIVAIFPILVLIIFGIPFLLAPSTRDDPEITLVFPCLLIISFSIFILISSGLLIKEILYYRYYFYDITEKEIIVKEGVVRRMEKIIFLSEIQDIYIAQSFLDRIFRLYNIYFSSAIDFGCIKGLNFSNVETLRELFIKKVGAIKKEESSI